MKKPEILYLKEKKMNIFKPYQLAKELGVKQQTIYRWIREGKFPDSSIKKVKVVKEITIIKLSDDILNKLKKNDLSI